jgi:hypothetical protein
MIQRSVLVSIGIILCTFGAHFVDATTIASVKLHDLFKQADLVAVVRIVSGDTEHYPTTVYKATIETPFKGATKGDMIFFGPFVGLGVGHEYVAFLRKSSEIRPNNGSSGLNYGIIPTPYEIMYDGYSILNVDYACVFDGQGIPQQCDYGVKLNPEQVVLPRNIKTFPPGDAGAIPNHKKWVRRELLLDELKRISSQSLGK